MATVYLADDLKHQRKVALKVLKPELAAVVGAERFLAEIKTIEGHFVAADVRAAAARQRPVSQMCGIRPAGSRVTDLL